MTSSSGSRRAAGAAAVAALLLVAGLGVWLRRPPSDATDDAHALTLWDEEQPDIQGILDEAIGRFEAQHPDVRVRRSHFKTEDLRTQFQTAAMAGKGADLVLAPNDFAGVFSVMGLIQEVGAWGALERFNDRSRAAITDAAGRSWGLPINLGNHLILFAHRGAVGAAPQTVEALEALRGAGSGGATWGLAYNALEPFWFVPFLGAFGGRAIRGTTPTLDTPAMRRALALVRKLKTDGLTPPDCDYACAETLFLEGKAATTINGDWAIGKYAAALGSDLLIAPLPRLAATGSALEPMVSGKYLLFHAGLRGDRLARAQSFGAFLTSRETQLFLAERSKRLPALAAALEDATVTSDPLLAASASAMVNAQPMPMAVQMRAVWDAIRPQLQAVMAGQTSPEAAAAVMQRDAEAKIGSLKR
jgi:arabinogalactan oligomer/maltooligosaccharide transport system substrate-binding protein